MTAIKDVECRDIQLHLVDYVQGKAGKMGGRIERHLSDCNKCGEWVTFVQSVNETFPEYSIEPDSTLLNMMAHIAEKAERRANPRRWGRMVSGVAAAMLILVICIFGGLLPDLASLMRWTGGMTWYQVMIVTILAVGGFFLISTPLLTLRLGHTTERIR